MTKAYKLGYMAYKAGVSEDDCPYSNDTNSSAEGRKQWLLGWDAAWAEAWYAFDEFEFV